MVPCVISLRSHFSNTRSIVLIGSGRGIVDGLGDAFLKFW